MCITFRRLSSTGIMWFPIHSFLLPMAKVYIFYINRNQLLSLQDTKLHQISTWYRKNRLKYCKGLEGSLVMCVLSHIQYIFNCIYCPSLLQHELQGISIMSLTMSSEILKMCKSYNFLFFSHLYKMKYGSKDEGNCKFYF